MDSLFYTKNGVAEKVLSCEDAWEHAGPHLLAILFNMSPEVARSYHRNLITSVKNYHAYSSLSSFIAEVLGVNGMGAGPCRAEWNMLASSSRQKRWSSDAQTEISDALIDSCCLKRESDDYASSFTNSNGSSMSLPEKLNKIARDSKSEVIFAPSVLTLHTLEIKCRGLHI